MDKELCKSFTSKSVACKNRPKNGSVYCNSHIKKHWDKEGKYMGSNNSETDSTETDSIENESIDDVENTNTNTNTNVNNRESIDEIINNSENINSLEKLDGNINSVTENENLRKSLSMSDLKSSVYSHMGNFSNTNMMNLCMTKSILRSNAHTKNASNNLFNFIPYRMKETIDEEMYDPYQEENNSTKLKIDVVNITSGTGGAGVTCVIGNGYISNPISIFLSIPILSLVLTPYSEL